MSFQYAINGHLLPILAALLLLPFLVPAAETEVKIKGIISREIRTPSFQDSQEGSRGAKERWLRLECEFSTKGQKWTDNLQVRWLVMVAGEAEKTYLLHTTVAYRDVKEGERHIVPVYIRPQFFARRAPSGRIETGKISVYAEILSDGKCLASAEKNGTRANSTRTGAKNAVKWYESTDSMIKLDNELLPKSATPFAPLDYDYYECEIPPSARVAE